MTHGKKGDRATGMNSPELLRFAVLAADVILFAIREGRLVVRLIPVKHFPNSSAREGFPGGLLLPSENAEETALRILETKTGISAAHVHLEQLYTFSRVDRDPRGRVVAVAYLALVPWDALELHEQGECAGSRWVPVTSATGLAYDHDEMRILALERLRSRIVYTTIIQKLLPKEFTLTDLEEAYELVLGRPIDKRNFRKKIIKLNILKELAHRKEGGRHRPARLYCFQGKVIKDIGIL